MELYFWVLTISILPKKSWNILSNYEIKLDTLKKLFTILKFGSSYNTASINLFFNLLKLEANLPLIIANTVENGMNILKNSKKIPSLHTLVMMDPPTPELYDTAKKEDIKLLTFQELEVIVWNKLLTTLWMET